VADLPHPLVRRRVVADKRLCRRNAHGGGKAAPKWWQLSRRGYGSACLAGLAQLRQTGPPVSSSSVDRRLLDNPTSCLRCAHHPRRRGRPGDRVAVAGQARGALCSPSAGRQPGGCLSIRLFFTANVQRSSGPRDHPRDALERLEMADQDFGWTAEMKVKGVRRV